MSTSPATYYDILNLSPALVTQQTDPSRLIKRAYRSALLNHHPDKKRHPETASASTATLFTIDQISTAYATLSNTASRAEYDRLLTSRNSSSSSHSPNSRFQTGIEVVDLDDLAYDEVGEGQGEGQWYRECRCGNARGYRFGESNLEEAADLGELMVGCADCSLWLRVQFAVVVDEGEGESEAEHSRGDGR